MTVTYRDGGPEDAEAIDRIFRTSFCETFAHLYRADDLTEFLAAFTPAAWRAELANPDYAFRLAQIEGDPVGYVKLGPSALPIEPAGPSMELRQLYLLKDHHGKGIASELMDWALGEARRRGKEQLYLTVFTDNLRARGLYERYGFEEVGPYKFMVGKQADEDIIMRKAL
jgi:GNAT superfamily N-acetyltransferase